MGTEYIYKICGYCGGDGKIQQTHDGVLQEVDCTNCNGTGKHLWGYLQDELEGEE